MADNEEKVVPKSSGNSNLIIIIGVALIVISLALSAVSLMTIMSINSKLEATAEAEEEALDPGVISVLEIDTFSFTEDFIFIFENEDGSSNNVVVNISVGIHNVADDAETVAATLAGKETILRDGVEGLVMRKTYQDFKSPEGISALKAEILSYLKAQLGTETLIEIYFNNLLTTS